MNECQCCGTKYTPTKGREWKKFCSPKCSNWWETWVTRDTRVTFSGARCLGYDTGVNKETRRGTCDWCEEEFEYETSFNKNKQTHKKEPAMCSKQCMESSRDWTRIREGEISYWYQLNESYEKRRRSAWPMDFNQNCWTATKKNKDRGIEGDIDADYLWSIRRTHCPALGYKFKVGEKANRKTGPKNWVDGPALDKFIPELGYVKGNVYYISNRANRIKADADWYEVMQVAIWMLGITLYTKVRYINIRTARLLLRPSGEVIKWMKKKVNRCLHFCQTQKSKWFGVKKKERK